MLAVYTYVQISRFRFVRSAQYTVSFSQTERTSSAPDTLRRELRVFILGRLGFAFPFLVCVLS